MSREARLLLGIGAVLLVVAVVVLALTSTSDGDGGAVAAGEGNDGGGAQLIREDSYQTGPADAPVTLVEFLDPECESCGAMHPTVARIREIYDGQLRFVVRYFPLHGNSVLAARAMEAAGRQDRYWEMYDLIFERQLEWGHQNEPQTELFMEYAGSLGLDVETFERDLADPALEAKVLRDQRDGMALGVEGTPTFFVNGQLIGHMLTFEQMQAQIEVALQ